MGARMIKLLPAFLGVLLVAGIPGAYADELNSELNNLIAIQTIILEAQDQSLEGQIAVGEVIRNRTDDVYTHGRYSERVKQVVRRPWQFSCWNSPLIAKLRLSRVSGKTFQRASRAWAESEHSQLVGESTHYHADYVKPYWAKGKKPAYKIGSHLFYEGIR